MVRVGRVTVSNGTDIVWEERGDGPPLLLIMGLGADRHAWDSHVADFSKYFRCIMPDNRGAGESGKPAGPYTTSMMADDMAAVIHATGFASVSVIGISLGGAIAQELAIRHPGLVRKLVLVSSWLRCGPFSAANFDELREIRPLVSPEAFTRRLQLLIWSADSFDSRSESFRDEQRSARYQMPHDTFAAQCDAAIAHDTSSTLPAVHVPTLVTAGSHDAFTPLRASKQIARAIDGASLAVFDGFGHAHHWEDLGRFNRLCERFLIDD